MVSRPSKKAGFPINSELPEHIQNKAAQSNYSQTWIQILTPLLTSYVILDKLLYMSLGFLL